MRRYNIIPRILLTLTVITFALAAPVQVQEKRQPPEDMITVLGKRILEEDFNVLWDGWWHHLNVLGEPPPPPQLLRPNPAGVHVPEVHVPPQGPADSDRKSTELGDDAPPSDRPSSLGSDSDSDRSSAISNAPSEESQPESEKLEAADNYDPKDKTKVLPGISGTASGVDMVNAAQTELRSSVDPGP